MIISRESGERAVRPAEGACVGPAAAGDLMSSFDTGRHRALVTRMSERMFFANRCRAAQQADAGGSNTWETVVVLCYFVQLHDIAAGIRKSIRGVRFKYRCLLPWLPLRRRTTRSLLTIITACRSASVSLYISKAGTRFHFGTGLPYQPTNEENRDRKVNKLLSLTQLGSASAKTFRQKKRLPWTRGGVPGSLQSLHPSR